MRDLRTLIHVELEGPLWHGEGAGVSERPAQADARTVALDSDGQPFAVYVCGVGELGITTPSGCLSLGSGDACVISPSDPHTVLASAQASYAHLELAPRVLEECLPDLPARSLALYRYAHAETPRATVLGGFFGEDVRLLLKRVEHRLSAGPGRWHLSLRGMVGDLLLALEEALSERRGGVVDVAEVVDYLQRNLDSASLRSTAEHFYCHPNSIANALKRTCGATFSEVLTGLRMQRAEALLQTSDLTVQDVAAACGYRNMTHFYGVFRERFAMSPGEFRTAVLAGATDIIQQAS